MVEVASFLEAVSRGRVAEAAEHLAEDVVVDDPRDGRVAGAESVRRWLAGTHEWLAALSARVEYGRITAAGVASVAEAALRVRVGGEEREVPVALAAAARADGRVRALRVYHSFWSLERRHRLRERLLPPRADLRLAPPVDAYHRALRAGDIRGVLACFQRGALVREPAGEPWVHRGAAGLSRIYGAMLWDGGIELEHCGVVEDGVACALEYNVVRWGRQELPPQPGLAVYERGRSGRLSAVRIYDDVDPPWG